jgi:hypothetical protein
MLKTGRIIPGQHVRSTLHWSRGDEPSGSISYEAIMSEPGDERLVLTYSRGSGADKESVRQEIRVVSTKLFLPPGGDRFASRKAWRIAYKSQRAAWHDKPFERLNRLQRKLGCREGYEEWLRRPKGMWRRTFERHEARYWQINEQCDRIWAGMAARLVGLRGRL